jgi:flagellar basal-body rod modification protein FlgD
MSIDTQSVYSQIGLATTATAAPAKSAMGQSDFLRLMTEQLKNQDPLKPLESTAFLGQLAQFSQVQGIQDLNSNFASLSSAMGSGSALQGAALIGHNVLVSGDTFSNTGSGISGAVSVAAAGNVGVNITDASGAIVRHMNLTSDGSGSMSYAWDGKTDTGATAAPGTYQVAASLDSAQGSIALQTQINARVESISLSATGLILNLNGLGATPLSAVVKIS